MGGVDELTDLRDSFLEQVTDSGAGTLEQSDRATGVDVLGEDEDCEVRIGRSQLIAWRVSLRRCSWAACGCR